MEAVRAVVDPSMQPAIEDTVFLLGCDNTLLDNDRVRNYPFADRLYPGALLVLDHLSRRGPTVILSDGDIVLQTRKLRRSGLWDAVEGRVLVYVHKENMLDDVAQRYPARHYVMVDDKLRILAAMKRSWRDRLTAIFVRQGHYALDPHELRAYPAADMAIEHIGDLLDRGHLASAPARHLDVGREAWCSPSPP